MMKTVNEVVMSVKLTPRKKLFVETASEMFGNGSTISRAIRSLTDPPGLNNSSFAKRLHSR